MSALAGGVFAATDSQNDDTQLRQLVDDLGRRSYDAGLGRRGIPEQFDAELWRNLEDTGLARLTSTPDMGAGPHELAIALYGVSRHAGAVPLAETDALAGWLGQQAGIELPNGPLTVAVADAETDGARVTGTATGVPWARACAAALLAVTTPAGLRVGVIDVASGDLQEGHNLAGEPRDSVPFDVSADQLHAVDPALGAELTRRGAWSRCVQTIRVLDAAAALSVEHTRQRVQFGRPLSAFQSVQQSLAGMAGEIERARAAAELAVAAASEHGFNSPTPTMPSPSRRSQSAAPSARSPASPISCTARSASPVSTRCGCSPCALRAGPRITARPRTTHDDSAGWCWPRRIRGAW